MNRKAKVSEKPLVCIVDDDSLMRDSTGRLIRTFGFRVKTFPSAEEFEKSAYVAETACLILDVRMPGMGGIELWQRLVANRRKIPTIFITAFEEEGMRAKALGDSVEALLTKPFGEEALMKAINEALAPR